MKLQGSWTAIGALLAAAGLAAGAAVAADARAAAIRVDGPWARPTVTGQLGGGGFVRIENRASVDDRLLSAHSPAAERVELHAMSMEGDVMRMRQLDGIDLPAGRVVDLKPGGLHLMFTGLKAPLREGTSLPLTLRFARAGELTVEMKVGSPPAGPRANHGGAAEH